VINKNACKANAKHTDTLSSAFTALHFLSKIQTIGTYQ